MKKKVNKDTKVYKERQIRKIRNRCLKLWKERVKARAGNKCEVPDCNEIERLNAHHIEVYQLNPYLRFSLNNGICLCPTHHKWGKASAHKSFLFMLKLMRLFPTRFCKLEEEATAISKEPTPLEQNLDYFNRVEQRLLADGIDEQLNGDKDEN